ncbi:putative secreted protein (Por secretion system target) [Dyadobacter jejuensis]|uniref:Putative secreted protein (Por secretion system target) n=1 Tax=Dyadobacter jejuensis TaxID=1082580 RepID=A0A316APG0_9BACT|nr:PA14 domain-containing protein [Dyadobacter jejuensis]PWJ59675.1 putative secreted protein (Por secretion system target) [Dyadobacter jejuensis]
MRNFFSLFIGLAWLCPIFIAFGQSNARTTQEEADDLMGYLDKSYVTSGILYNRAFPAASLNIFGTSEVSNSGHWLEARAELYKGALNTSGLLSTESLQSLIYQSNNEQHIVPIGISLIQLQEINSSVVETDPDGRLRLKAGFSPSQTFNTKQAVVASALVPSVPIGTSSFQLPRWATFSNQGVGINSVVVNFGDGGSSRTLTPGGSSVQVTYGNAGIKQLNFTITCSDGSQRTAKSELEVIPQARVNINYPYFDGVSTVDSIRITADIPFQGYDETSAYKGKGDVFTYYAARRSQLRKPVILIDGFDPMDTRGGQKFYDDNMQYIDGNGQPQLLGHKFRENTPDNGYDLIILNAPTYEYTSINELICPLFNGYPFPTTSCWFQDVPRYRAGGGDYIERNAMVLVKLIQTVNQQLQANGSNEKITIIGPSMGGLISRYALRYMEQNNMNHNCKLWVSFDVPHHGANIPVGLQDMLVHMDNDMNLEGPRKAVKELLLAPAARQMLIHHYEGKVNDHPGGSPGFRDRFVQTMNAMGFPQASCLRRVALNNGSKNGTNHNFPAGGQAMEIKAETTALATITCAFTAGFFCLAASDRFFSMKVFTAPSGNIRGKVMDKSFINFGWGGAERFVYGVGQPSMDILPGGYGDYFQLIVDQAKSKKWMYKTMGSIQFSTPSFIPSVSSFALKNLNRDWGASLSNINVQTDTPFDAIYAPDANEKHTIITQAGVDFIRAQLAIADQGCTPIYYLPLPNGCYTIKAKHSNKFLQPENGNNGARIRQYGANGQNNQIFQLESVNSDTYRIISQSSNKVWELAGGNTTSGTPIQQADWSGNYYQRWSVRSVIDGTYTIGVTSKFGVGLADVEGISGSDGAGLHFWGETNGDNQRYYFNSVSCSGSNPPTGGGTGLTGNYFNNQSLNGSPNLTRIDETVNFAWGGDGPGSSIGFDNFSVRWEGQVEAPYSGNITFKTNNDDGTRLWVNGQLLIDNWVDQGPTWKNGIISLTSGQKYNIKMEYYENGGGAQAQLFWEYPGQTEQIVPKVRLFPLNGCTPPAAPTVTANPTSITSGHSSQLSATNCSGNITWSHGLSGNPVQVNPTVTTTYTATCTVNGCSSSSNVTVPVGNNTSTCNCGFSLLSATQNSGQYTASFQFNSCSVSQVNWSILSGSTVVASGTANVTAATVPFTVPSSVNTGNYTLKVDVINCTGTGTVAFNYTKPGGNTTINCTTLNGHFDGANCGTMGGWAYDYSNPNTPVYIDILEGSTVIQSNIPAANFRQDLLNAGLGNGVHGFEINTPSSLKNGQNRVLSARVSGCSFVLHDSPRTLYCASGARIGVPETGLETPEMETQTNTLLIVSPNPNNGAFKVSFDLTIGEKATLTVYETKGNAIFERSLVGKGTHQEKVKLADSSAGIFLVELRKANGLKVKKILVLK